MMKHRDCEHFEPIGICTDYSCPGVCTKNNRDVYVDDREYCHQDTRPDVEVIE